MKKRMFRSIMIIFIVLLFVISISFLPAIADPGDGNGEGNNGMDPPKGPDDDKGGDENGSGDQNQEGKNGEEHDDSGYQNQEGNDDDHNGEQNQERHQNRFGDYDIDDDQKRYQQRRMEMEFERNRTRIRSEWEQDNYEDEFEILFEIDHGPRLRLDYENNLHSSENELSFDVKIRELIEYRDTNRNGRYDEDDIIVNNYSFENKNFKNFTYQNQLSDDGMIINFVSTQTEDDIFKINLYFSGNFSEINNQILSPSEVKIDFIINNYPYEEEETQLALRTMLNTKHETELETVSFDEAQGFSENESVLDINTLNNDGFFSWAETVIVDGIVKPVNSTINSETEETIIENEKISNKISNIYFSYPRGTNIFHDPKVGIVSISFEAFALQSISNLINTDNILSYVGICILASIMFLGVIVIRKRF